MGGSSQQVRISKMWPAVGATAVVGAVSILGLQQFDSTSKPGIALGRMPAFKPMRDEVFEVADNLFVILLEPTELLDRKEEIQRVIRTLAQEPSLHRLSYFFKVDDKRTSAPSETKPTPESFTEAAVNAVTETKVNSLRVILYKGRRKIPMRLRTDVPREQITEIVSFYSPVSQHISEARRAVEVPHVSGLTFNSDIVSDSGYDKGVLLQMYEDTCYLCFIMRPFINSLAQLLRENGVPLRIKRLNIERNDFPDGCPVARGTPTFVLFQGPKAKPAKWDEFKPDEVVARIKKLFPGMGEKVRSQAEPMLDMISTRTELFMQVVMWAVELQALERQYNSTSHATTDGQHDADLTSDPDFETVVTELMQKDMKRNDGIVENIDHLDEQVKEIEHDALVLGMMLAQKVVEREQRSADLGVREGWL